MKDKKITIAFPHEIWVAIRRLQEEGQAGSFQQFTLEAIQEKLEKEEI